MTMNEQFERAKDLVKRLPPVGPRPKAELDEVVALLQQPTALFGAPSGLCDGACWDRPTRQDWHQVADDLHRVLRQHGVWYSHAIQMLQVAAQVLREHALKLADCPPRVTMSPPEIGRLVMRYELRIDESWETAHEVSDAYLWRVIDMDLHIPGFRITFKGRSPCPLESVSEADMLAQQRETRELFACCDGRRKP